MLRYWETEFPSLKPSKSKSGQRVYTDEEIGVVRRIKELLYEEGYTIAGAKKRLESELEDGTEMLDLKPETASADATSDKEPAPEPVQAEAEDQADDPEPDAGSSTVTEAAAEQPEPDDDEPEEDAASVDTEVNERIETLEQGVGAALEEVREILSLLRDGDASAE